MPFKSEKQRRYLFANEPEIAKDWTETYGSRIQKNNGGIISMQGGMKNYAGGHDNHQYNNIYGWIGTNPRDCQSNGMCGICFDITPQLEGHIDWYFNNSCVIDQNKPPLQYGFINMPNKNCSYKNEIKWPLVSLLDIT